MQVMKIVPRLPNQELVPPDQRRLLVLHYVVGLSVEAIAQETGTPTGTVKSRLSRGRAALRAELQEEAEHDV
ncbi:hypothetical protein GCM10020218_046390 [Dactylosporangium vinaceum]